MNAPIDEIFKALHDQMDALDSPESAVVKATLGMSMRETRRSLFDSLDELVRIYGTETIREALDEIETEARS
jgi:hypothetical protein